MNGFLLLGISIAVSWVITIAVTQTTSSDLGATPASFVKSISVTSAASVCTGHTMIIIMYTAHYVHCLLCTLLIRYTACIGLGSTSCAMAQCPQ